MDVSSDEEYDPKKDVKRQRLATRRTGANKAGSTGNRMSGGVSRSYSKSNGTVKAAGEVAGRVGMVVKTTATSTGPIGATPGLTVAAHVSTLKPVVNPTTEVSNLISTFDQKFRKNVGRIFFGPPCIYTILVLLRL
jgi:hypothetical protein